MKDDRIYQNYEKFCKDMENTDLLQIDNITLEREDNYGTVSIPLTQQMMMDDFIEQVMQFLNLKVLYAYKDNDGQHYKSVTYSMPYQDELYVIGIESHQHGAVDDIQVLFYESMEDMLSNLFCELTALKYVVGEVMEKQKLEEVYALFM